MKRFFVSEDFKRKMGEILPVLPFREREVVKRRCGIDTPNGYVYTLEEVSRIFKMTRERIRQIESKAARKLIKKFTLCPPIGIPHDPPSSTT